MGVLLAYILIYGFAALLVFGIPTFLLVRRLGWTGILIAHFLATVIIIITDVTWVQYQMSKPGWDGAPDMDFVFYVGVLMRLFLVNVLILLPIDIAGFQAQAARKEN